MSRAGDLRVVLDLNGGEGLDDHVRGHDRANPAEHVEVELERPVGMQSTHDVKLVRSIGDCFFGGARDLVERHLVGAFLSLRAGERAELAPVLADVRRIDMAIHHEVDAIAVDASTCEVGHLTDAYEVVARVEGNAVLARQSLAAQDFGGDGLKVLVLEVEAHGGPLHKQGRSIRLPGLRHDGAAPGRGR